MKQVSNTALKKVLLSIILASSSIHAQTIKPVLDSEQNDDQTYNITEDFQSVDESKLPEVLLLTSIIAGIMLIGIVLYCCVCKNGKDAPEAEEVDVTEKFDIENV